MKIPYAFDEFFASGQEETLSPFLTTSSQKMGKQLSLKRSCAAFLFLSMAFFCRNIDPTVASILLVLTYFLAGTPALIDTLHDVGKGEINIDVLMTLAALLSVIIGSGMEGGLLLVLFAISGAMEEMVQSKTKQAITHLHDITPKFGTVVESDGSHRIRSIKDIPLGSILSVRVGDIIPLDGIILEGTSSVNMSHMSGESIPIAKIVGDAVVAGSVNLEGGIILKVTSTFAESTLSKMVALITGAAENKPPLQRFIDRFDTLYAKIVISLFIVFALGLPWIFSIPYFGIEGSVYRSLAFLIAASPCALVIATPTAYLSAISALARKGILLKGGVVLDGIASCRAAAFDKTGTLTKGKLSLVSIEHLLGPPLAEKLILSTALALEQQAVHPIAEAIIQKAQAASILADRLQHHRVIPGQGVIAVLQDGTPCGIGNLALMKAQGFDLPEGGTFLYRGATILHFVFEDTIKMDIKESLQALKAQGIETMSILSGDKQHIVSKVASFLGIEDARGEMSPADKLEMVTELSNRFGLMMVGDGINDAPALARSTIGISMGQIGSKTAASASDVILLDDDLTKLPLLRKKALQTKNIVKQNVIVALIVILCATTPALLGKIPLWMAVILHEGGTVLVGLNSLRLLRN